MAVWPPRAQVGASALCADAEGQRHIWARGGVSTCEAEAGTQTHPQWAEPAACAPMHARSPAHRPCLGLTQDTHLLYVLAAANLYARMHGLPGSRDQEALREMLQSPLPPDLQHLDSIFPSDLASTEPGRARPCPSPCCPPKARPRPQPG